MRRTRTIIGVGDVPSSVKWYQSLLWLPETAPAHDDFGHVLAELCRGHVRSLGGLKSGPM
jgi:hypothetical protein